MEVPVVIDGRTEPTTKVSGLEDSVILFLKEKDGLRRCALLFDIAHFGTIRNAFRARQFSADTGYQRWAEDMQTKGNCVLTAVVITNLGKDTYNVVVRFRSTIGEADINLPLPVSEALAISILADCPLLMDDATLTEAEAYFVTLSKKYLFVDNPLDTPKLMAERVASHNAGKLPEN